MNFNVWNVKEMLSIPSGSGITKPSNWNNNQTDCSLSDSQFLFGSQFCPENSETLLPSLDAGACLRHPKQTQQNSVDLQTSVEKTEENLSSRSQSILDSVETIAKTFQETARVQHDLMVESVRDKGSMEQAILEIQRTCAARQAEFMEMKSTLKNLEVLVVEQTKNLQQF